MQDMLLCKQACTKQQFFLLKHQAHTVQVHHTRMSTVDHLKEETAQAKKKYFGVQLAEVRTCSLCV